MNNIIPVVLCGGSGTRLWPLSRKSFPKQFVPLIDGKSLLQLTLERVAVISRQVLCVASEEHRFLVADTLDLAAVSGTVILEPVARNTAAAMALAALQAQRGAKRDELLLFCPADHHIPDARAFEAAVVQGRSAAESGSIVTFGILPTCPSTAYGYIQQGETRADGSRGVRCFIEKPDVEKAQQLILQGDVLWNAGIFLVRADVLLAALEQHAPDIFACCCQAMAGAVTDRPEIPSANRLFIRPEFGKFERCRAESIDYAVMEKHADIVVAPFCGQWSDVGSWNAVAELSAVDTSGNRGVGQGVALYTTNSYIHAPHRPVVALGVQDLLIIDTPDAVLVAHRRHAEKVKEVVARLDGNEALAHRKVHRPWGWYDSIDTGSRFQVKRILIKPGAALSLQMHHHRAEHWVVVQGTAQVTRGSESFLLSENQSAYIPLGEKHRLANPGKVPLEIIEVQSGAYLGEDDIERFDDNYGRHLQAVPNVFY